MNMDATSSTQFVLRYAQEHEKEFVYALNRTVYHDVVIRQFGTWDDDGQRQYFDEKWTRATYRIIEQDGTPIGVIWVTEHADHHVLHEIQLHPDWQGQGIGSRVIRHHIHRARDRQCSLRLRVLTQNTRAQQLYARLGFLVVQRTATHLYMEYPITW